MVDVRIAEKQLEDAVQIIPELWYHIVTKVIGIKVRLPPTDEGMRFSQR